VAQNVKLLSGLRLPSRTVTVVSSGLELARALRRGAIRLPELERLIGRIFLRAHVPHEDGIRLPIIDFLTLAEDVDTVEEASQLAREMQGRGGPHAQRGG
jgi:hypothetical protein